MTGGIYLIQRESGDLVEMTEQPYDSEDLLQRLLARHPALLAGEQINRSDPRRWLLVSREASLPSEENGGGRWSVDHLFLDQDGIPTLVEVKRSSDSRIRREVVGQMLDYAANAVLYWPIERLQLLYEATCERDGLDADEQLAALTDGKDSEEFWRTVKTNLQAGRVRLLFVSDVIPSELRRVVEFLNEQMDPAEVLAVEVRQFVGSQVQAIVPQVLGQTAEAERKKSGGPRKKRKWDEESFFTELEQYCSDDEVAAAHRLQQWSQENMTQIWWGEGVIDGSFVPVLNWDGEDYIFFTVWTKGRLEVTFQYLKRRPPFQDEALRKEFLRRLNAIDGVVIPNDGIGRRPTITLAPFAKDGGLERLLDVFEWAKGRIVAQD